MTAAEHIVPPEELMAYLDGELSPERAKAVLTHVTSCAACQRVADDLRGVSAICPNGASGDAVNAWRPGGLHLRDLGVCRPARSAVG
jgi:anti-sigma factor RsiW